MNTCLSFILVVQSLYAISDAASLQPPPCPGPCTRIFAPVCGSDGKTYPNECELENVACLSPNPVQKLYDGKCDVCSLDKVVGPCFAAFRQYYYNKTSEKCEMFIYGGCSGNDNNFDSMEKCQKATKHCACPQICTMEYNPQCGIDGVTYSNPCELKVETCKSNGKVFLDYEGKCGQCPSQRKKLLGKSGPLIGQFVPECELDGSYKEVQCWGSVGQCWCVDRVTGKKVDGTMTRGTPNC